jgi:hypothetical protein
MLYSTRTTAYNPVTPDRKQRLSKWMALTASWGLLLFG